MNKIDTSSMGDQHPAILRLANAVNEAIESGGDIDIDLGSLNPRPKSAHVEVIRLKLQRLGLWCQANTSSLRVAESAPAVDPTPEDHTPEGPTEDVDEDEIN